MLPVAASIALATFNWSVKKFQNKSLVFKVEQTGPDILSSSREQMIGLWMTLTFEDYYSHIELFCWHMLLKGIQTLCVSCLLSILTLGHSEVQQFVVSAGGRQMTVSRGHWSEAKKPESPCTHHFRQWVGLENWPNSTRYEGLQVWVVANASVHFLKQATRPVVFWPSTSSLAIK